MSSVSKVLILIFSLIVVDLAIVKYVNSPSYSFLRKIINPPSKLEKVVKQVLSGTEGTYSVAIKNLQTGESYYLDEKKQFEAASLYKIWILAETMNQIEKGKIEEGDVLKEEIAQLNQTFEISSESAELTEGVLEITVAGAMKQMITISHNYSALILIKKIGLSNVNKFIKDNNFNQTRLAQPPKTTAFDILLFFEKLYKGELVTKKKSSAMLELLKKQQLNDRLPKYLPQQTVIAHKTGELGFLTHDGGIIYGKKSDYIIVVLSESNFPPGAEERIALISKAVYAYFEK